MGLQATAGAAHGVGPHCHQLGHGHAAKRGIGYRPSADNSIEQVFRPRLCHAWVSAVCKGGIHAVSIYLKHTEELYPDNIEILDAAAQLISTLTGPWVLAGDFNLEPEALKSSGFLELTNGRMMAPEKGTCNGRKYDYFVVAQCLAPFVHSVTALDYPGCSPHAPVRLLLRGDARRLAVRKIVRPARVAAVLQHGPQQDPSMLPKLYDEANAMRDTKAALAAWLTRADAEFALLGANRPMDGHIPPRVVWACPLGITADPTPGADRISVLWKLLGSKSKIAATHHRYDTDSGRESAKQSIAKAASTVRWAKDRPDYADHIQDMTSWVSSLETAFSTGCARWIDRLSNVAEKHELKQCNRSKNKQIAAWKQHFRHDAARMGNGYAPTRRAFQYVRGPMGWTQAPVAAATEEDETPELEMDHHDDHLVRAAELYQSQDGTLTSESPAFSANISTVLSPQAEVEAEANR